MNTGDSCPPESPAGEEENGDGEEPAEGEPEESAEEEVAMDAIAAKLPVGLDDLVLARMGCIAEDVRNGDCRNQEDAIGIAKQIDQDISGQLPNTEVAAGILFYIHLVTTYAYSRDTEGELIFPSLNASLPVVIQLAWNSIEDPGQLHALYRYVAILMEYDNQRYAADHGE